MRHGVLPTKPDHRDKSFPGTFGSVSPTLFPDQYDCDAGLGMPDQNADGYPEGCTGYAQTELCQDEDLTPYDPEFTYKKTLFMMDANEGEPCDMRTSLKSLIVYGPKAENETDGFAHKRGQYFNVEDKTGFDSFDDVRNALWLNRMERRSVSCGTPWFPEWENPRSGVLSMPTTPISGLPWHNYKISGWKQINGQPHLIAKTWQGKQYGDNGWCYIPRDVFNKVMAIYGTAAFTVTKASPQYAATVRLDIQDVIASYLRRAIQILSQLALIKATNGTVTPPQPPVVPAQPSLPSNAALLVQAAKSALGRNLSAGTGVPYFVACALSVNRVHDIAFGFPIGGGASTADLYSALLKSTYFKQVPIATEGCVVISPTGHGTNPAYPHGHVGIVGKYGVCSNDSDTGLFSENYTVDSWTHEFHDVRGYPVYYFERL